MKESKMPMRLVNSDFDVLDDHDLALVDGGGRGPIGGPTVPFKLVWTMIRRLFG